MSDQLDQPGEMPPESTETANSQRTSQDYEAEIERLSKALKEVNKESASRRKKLEEYESAQKAKEDAELTETEKLRKQLAEYEAQLKAKDFADLQRVAAEKADLPPAFADRLRGNTLEELIDDAKKILEALPKAPKPPPVSPTSPGAGASQKETTDQQRARIYGYGVDVMSKEYAEAHGGGVLWKDKPLEPPG